MMELIFIGFDRTDPDDPPKGQPVMVTKIDNKCGLDVVQIRGYEKSSCGKDMYFSIRGFREPLDHGEHLVRELAYKQKWISSERYPKIQMDELKKEAYLRTMRK